MAPSATESLEPERSGAEAVPAELELGLPAANPTVFPAESYQVPRPVATISPAGCRDLLAVDTPAPLVGVPPALTEPGWD